MHSSALLLALASVASAKLGFNYGSTFTTGAAKQQSDFENEFTTAANLKGASGFTSARLYTMVQAGSASDPISAIPAAIKTGTTLLLGLWASGGDDSFANEITALKAAIEEYGDDFTSIVDGISIGSEDLYRASPQGIAAGSNVGAEPDTLVRYIKEVRSVIEGTSLANAPLGHVDTWTAWENGTNSIVVDELDWLGMDAYPYFQDTMPNGIQLSKSLFDAALGTTKAAANGRAVWVTETGFPVSGKTYGDAVPSIANAKTYWRAVGCPMFDNTNVWWYTLQDAQPDTPNPSFGLINGQSTTPLYDLSCDDAAVSSSTSSTLASKVTSTTKPTSTGKASSANEATSTGESASTGKASSTKAPGNGTETSETSGSEATATATTMYGSLSPTSPVASQTTNYGSGYGSGSGSGYNSGASNSTSSGAASSTPSATYVPIASAINVQSGGLAAAFVAIMATIFAL
ncbi:glycoside hydrolase family 17, beta-1,3-endoglucanase [Xylariaceae sp. FL1019]|nr:glycoside hydrolase family 17, beta-1,3-endoglucanase [Xylariaceae sp. FL1019]